MRQLEQDFPHLLASGQASAYDTVAFAQNETIRDLQSVIKASRALSEEINLERLIENLMTILLERAGAQRGLLLRVSESLIPEIEASAWTSTEGVRVRILKDVPTATDLPSQRARHSRRVGEAHARALDRDGCQPAPARSLSAYR